MRRLDWDYSSMADAYLSRPDYADAAVDRVLEAAGLRAGEAVVELGAGAAHLTRMLAERGLSVLAIEPNAQMRAHGGRRTRGWSKVQWRDAVMEDTGLDGGGYALAAYGSSFGVADHTTTLREAARLLRPDGWFACWFNHRDLDDPLQRQIEAFIRQAIPGYESTGARRRDQSEYIDASGLFGRVERFEVPILHRLPAEEWLRAWRSHATVQRLAGERFAAVLDGIDAIVRRSGDGLVEVPYTTRAWLAQRCGEPGP